MASCLRLVSAPLGECVISVRSSILCSSAKLRSLRHMLEVSAECGSYHDRPGGLCNIILSVFGWPAMRRRCWLRILKCSLTLLCGAQMRQLLNIGDTLLDFVQFLLLVSYQLWVTWWFRLFRHHDRVLRLSPFLNNTRLKVPDTLIVTGIIITTLANLLHNFYFIDDWLVLLGWFFQLLEIFLGLHWAHRLIMVQSKWTLSSGIISSRLDDWVIVREVACFDYLGLYDFEVSFLSYFGGDVAYLFLGAIKPEMLFFFSFENSLFLETSDKRSSMCLFSSQLIGVVSIG